MGKNVYGAQNFCILATRDPVVNLKVCLQGACGHGDSDWESVTTRVRGVWGHREGVSGLRAWGGVVREVSRRRRHAPWKGVLPAEEANQPRRQGVHGFRGEDEGG